MLEEVCKFLYLKCYTIDHYRVIWLKKSNFLSSAWFLGPELQSGCGVFSFISPFFCLSDDWPRQYKAQAWSVNFRCLAGHLWLALAGGHPNGRVLCVERRQGSTRWDNERQGAGTGSRNEATVWSTRFWRKALGDLHVIREPLSVFRGQVVFTQATEVISCEVKLLARLKLPTALLWSGSLDWSQQLFPFCVL